MEPKEKDERTKLQPTELLVSDSKTMKVLIEMKAAEAFLEQHQRSITKYQYAVIKINHCELLATTGRLENRVRFEISDFDMYNSSVKTVVGNPTGIWERRRCQNLPKALRCLRRKKLAELDQYLEDDASSPNDGTSPGSQPSQPSPALDPSQVPASDSILMTQAPIQSQDPFLSRASPRPQTRIQDQDVSLSHTPSPGRAARASKSTENSAHKQNVPTAVGNRNNLLNLLDSRPKIPDPNAGQTEDHDELPGSADDAQFASQQTPVATPEQSPAQQQTPHTAPKAPQSAQEMPNDEQAPSSGSRGGKDKEEIEQVHDEEIVEDRIGEAGATGPSPPRTPVKGAKMKVSPKSSHTNGDTNGKLEHGIPENDNAGSWPPPLLLQHLNPHTVRRISKDQAAILDRPDSWCPAPPGMTFPTPNLPIAVLEGLNKRALRTNATRATEVPEVQPEKNIDAITISSSKSESSSDEGSSLPNEGSPLPDEGSPLPDEASQLSWSPSQRSPARKAAELPPDSSGLEMEVPHAVGESRVEVLRTPEVKVGDKIGMFQRHKPLKGFKRKCTWDEDDTSEGARQDPAEFARKARSEFLRRSESSSKG